ncbi:hypothetical protein E9840_09470 [Tissierella creatinini]|nr:hypothetical protein E9840_09470 [Tissierella creatinini]TJX61389.1 hypothetical protein E8P77_18725 [Soehngenia saccharolytica]
MNHNTIYNNQYTDIGFDRTSLFEFIKEVFHSEKVLYPGSSIHISPSFIFEHVIYVDKSKAAEDFFMDNQAVKKIIENNRRGNGSRYYEFLSFDYINEGLPLRDYSFDLLISLYADNIIDYCRRYVRDKGMIISNNFHDEALKAVKYDELTLVGYIHKTKNRYAFYNDEPTRELKHRDEEKIQKLCMKNKNGSIWYEDKETYYVFQLSR